MTDKIKKWLIRRSEGVKKVDKTENGLLIISTITLIIYGITNYLFFLCIGLLSLLLALLLRFIVIFLEAINKNKEKLLQNKIIYIVLSEYKFVQDYFYYFVKWPIMTFSIALFFNIPEERHFIAILLLLVLFISLWILEIKLSEKISSIFKQKLS